MYRYPRPAGRPMAAALEPLAMQAPLATRRQQPVGRQQQQHLVPTCPPCGSGPSRRAQNRSSASSRHRFTASQHPPHCRGRHSRSSESFSRTTAASGQHPHAAVFREQRQRARRRRSFLKDGDRLRQASSCRSVDLAQVQRQRPLHHTVSAYSAISSTMLPVTVLFAVLLALGVPGNITPRMIPAVATRKMA